MELAPSLRIGSKLGKAELKIDQVISERTLSNYRRLKELADLKVTNRQLDHYLWIGGQYRAWKRNPGTRLNREVLDLFENPTPEAAAELDVLLPSMQEATSEGESS